MNLAALDAPAEAGAVSIPDTSALAGVSGMFDQDGLLIPPRWQAAPNKWRGLPLTTRQNLSRAFAPKPEKKAGPSRAGVTRFTTDYAVKWGRSQGWKLIDRENYDFKNKRHHDLMFGMDALFDDGGNGMVAIQGAGQNEKTKHRQRFDAAGGKEKATRRGVRCVYLEFVRGKPAPILEEWWS